VKTKKFVSNISNDTEKYQEDKDQELIHIQKRTKESKSKESSIGCNRRLKWRKCQSPVTGNGKSMDVA